MPYTHHGRLGGEGRRVVALCPRYTAAVHSQYDFLQWIFWRRFGPLSKFFDLLSSSVKLHHYGRRKRTAIAGINYWRGTAWRGATVEGPRDAGWRRFVSAEAPREAVVLLERDRAMRWCYCRGVVRHRGFRVRVMPCQQWHRAT